MDTEDGLKENKIKTRLRSFIKTLHRSFTRKGVEMFLARIKNKPFIPFLIVVCLWFFITLTIVSVRSDPRAQMYIIQAGIIFFLPIFLIDYDKYKNLRSKSRILDIFIGCGIVVFILIFNFVKAPTIFGIDFSPRFGFTDMIVIIGGLTILFFGVSNLKKFFTPFILVISLALIMSFVSTENATFNRLIGNSFVYFTTVSTVSVLTLLGYSVTAGSDYIILPRGDSTLTVWIGVRCGGIDAVLIYSLLLAVLLLSLNAPRWKLGILVACGVIGTFLVNVFRVLILCLIGIHYGVNVLEAAHSHLGDLLFVAYIGLFWWIAFRYVLKEGVVKEKDTPANLNN